MLMKWIIHHSLLKIYSWIVDVISFIFIFWWIFIPLALVVHGFFEDESPKENKNSSTSEIISTKPTLVDTIPVQRIEETKIETKSTANPYDYWYQWAKENVADNFDDCQSEFGTSEEEDWCNEYVKENYKGYQDFHSYECTEDCSGHEAGYSWAENNDISDTSDCGDSQSFAEGCEAYVEENY